MASDLAALTSRLEYLERELRRLQDIEEIRHDLNSTMTNPWES